MLGRLAVANFRLLHRVERWITRRLTPIGLLVLGAFAAAAVFGLDVRSTYGLRAAGFSGGLLLIALVCALTLRCRVGVQRHLPRYATAGEPFVYGATLVNEGARLVRGLVVRERLEEWLPSHRDLLARRAPASGRRGLLRRRITYPRWAWLVRQSRGAVVEESEAVQVPARGTQRVDLRMTPTRRGWVRLQGLDVSRCDPLGLVRSVAERPAPAALLVLPTRHPVAWPAIAGVEAVEPGDNVAVSSGDSEAFSTVREYRPGDPLRHLHWPSYARVGEPIVKVFERLSEARHTVVLDTFAGDAPAETFERAVSVAAALVFPDEGAREGAGLLFVSKGEAFTSCTAETVVELEALALVSPGEKGDIEAVASLTEANAERISVCACVLMAWDAPRQTLVRRLQLAGLDVVALVIDEGSAESRSPGPLVDEPGRLRFIPANAGGPA